jgi:mercuric ion transport protein
VDQPATPEFLLTLRVQIELVYDSDCPNVDTAREVLAAACRATEIPAVWREWNSEDPTCPAHALNRGSPTILVNGEDVAPGPHQWAQANPGEGPRCRVYRDGDAIVKSPPLERVALAITEAMGPQVV